MLTGTVRPLFRLSIMVNSHTGRSSVPQLDMRNLPCCTAAASSRRRLESFLGRKSTGINVIRFHGGCLREGFTLGINTSLGAQVCSPTGVAS
jgi:hypothetical protein